MKRFLLVLLLLSASVPCAVADIVAQWNFNSIPADSDAATGTNVPSIGMGIAVLVGGVSATFLSGSGSSDPAVNTDDSGWNTKDYPVQSTGNKTGGVEFDVSTVGYSNIVVRWDHRATKTASKYYRLQYCTDGNTFLDYSTPVTIHVDSVFEIQTNSLAATFGVNNNSNFRFRILSEFESSATGGGLNGYATPYGTNSYDPNMGSVRFDYVTVLGIAIPGGNTAPTITGLGNQTIRVTQSTGALPFTVLDAEDPAANLTLNPNSSNPSVIPLSNISFGGGGSSRTVTVNAASQAGTSTITVWVIDTGGKSNSTSFVVAVLPANTAPVISTIAPTNSLMNTAVLGIPFTVGDAETPASVLTLSGSSSNTTLVPNGNITFGGGGSNRTVTVTPMAGQTGVAPINVTVSDGTNTAHSTFAVMVSPSPTVIFLDSFSYGDGSIISNSGFLWQNRSGTDGECQVTNGQLQVTADLSEDIVGRLVGAPYDKNNGTVLYSSFKVKFLNLPNSTPDYFAHFANGSTLRGRVYAAIPVGSPYGLFRLHAGNGTNSTELPIDITTNVTYTVVTRYNIDSPATTLWLNPASESDAGAMATDIQTPAAITSYGFRESLSFDATVFIDDLKVGLSFAAVTGTNFVTVTPTGLSSQRIGNNLVLTWTNPAFSLQAASFTDGPFTNVPSASSPYTNSLSGAAKYFRLKAN
jgi:hypothetical protein